jgi:hypothetical protein
METDTIRSFNLSEGAVMEAEENRADPQTRVRLFCTGTCSGNIPRAQSPCGPDR